MKKKYHPEGVANLLAAILCTGDIAKLPPEAQTDRIRAKAIDFRRGQVLELARAYYGVNDLDFDNTVDLRDRGTNNLAKLTRTNLYKV